MCAQAAVTFAIKSWDESAIEDFEKGEEVEQGPTIRRAVVTKTYRGDLEGEGKVVYQMLGRADGSAVFLGFEVVTGSLNGKSGSFVFEHRGTFEDGAVKSVWRVVSGAATGKLSGLRGEVAFAAGHQDEYSITFDYDFE